ncbi:MAG: FKBP-type peptidyl-prolyl cis-trans isomerase [Gammaproteobacteria bacterium]|nr:FKBP-type peptidyl-prolyl cis-trans isomerase [Gammaproteobacteria bacterium]
MTRLYLHRHWLAALSLTLFSLSGNAQEDDPVIGEGSTVGFEYTLSLSDGTVVESNVGGDPFSYTQGGSQILPALEAALNGLAVEDTRQVTLEPADAYGDVNPEAFQEIPIAQIPEEARVVGTILGAEGYQGPIRVHEVKEDIVILDFNNPLAGKTLTFDIRIVSLQ